MKREIDENVFKKFVDDNFKSVQEFMNISGLSRSHVYKLFKGLVKVGDRTYLKLNKIAKEYGFDDELFYKTEKFEIAGGVCRSISITDKDKNLIALIDKDRLVIRDDYEYFIED